MNKHQGVIRSVTLKRIAIAASTMLIAAVPALAGEAETFDQQLAKALQPQTEAQAKRDRAMGIKPKRGKGKGKAAADAALAAQPAWSVPNDGTQAAAPCTMLYGQNGSAMGYMGGLQGEKSAYFFVAGPDVPLTVQAKKMPVTLRTAGEPDQTVNAALFPVSSDRSAIAFQIPALGAALNVMNDVETVTVLIDGNVVFQGNWTGGHAARSKIQPCLAAKGLK